MTTVCKLAPVFTVKESRTYFLTSPQGMGEKFGLGTRLGASMVCKKEPSKIIKEIHVHLC